MLKLQKTHQSKVIDIFFISIEKKLIYRMLNHTGRKNETHIHTN